MSESATPADRDGQRPLGRRVWRGLLDVVVIVVVALLVSFLVKTFLIRPFFVPSESMENTLQIGDRVVVDEIGPRLSGIHRGDVVVFRDPGNWLPARSGPAPGWLDQALTAVGLSAADSDQHLVKRVIGIGGDHVACCTAEGKVTVNGVAITEPYILLPPEQKDASLVPFSVTVPEGSLWVMGDNRDHSADSRFHTSGPGGGSVPVSGVVGRVFVIMWPPGRWSWVGSYPETFAAVP
ncbi:signal peptidase I [Leifsonia sp. LS-T14]|uniref:signal peptidase I n=1 Tax=unclassified Leifsonia TaxID=2663824 RepID=UPI0035A58ED9